MQIYAWSDNYRDESIHEDQNNSRDGLMDWCMNRDMGSGIDGIKMRM